MKRISGETQSKNKRRTNVRAARLFCVQDVKTLAIPEERTRGPATTPLIESTARPKTLRTTAARAPINMVRYEGNSGWCRIYHPSISQPLPASEFQPIIVNTHSSRAHGTLVKEMEREVTRRGDKETGGRKGSDEFEGFILNK